MIQALTTTSQVVMGLAALLVLVRALRGPTPFDRTVAIDTLALAVIGFLLLQAYGTDGRLYTDAALGLALFAFVATVLLAFFLGRGDLE